jgi:transcriptional regulator with XRE-family HTH domain
MKITELLSDELILTELGNRLNRARLDRQLSQADLAEQAGVSKRTVERIEAGASAQSSSLVRVLRALDKLVNLDRLVPESGPSPLDLLKRQGKIRKRASSPRQTRDSDKPWSWDDDA